MMFTHNNYFIRFIWVIHLYFKEKAVQLCLRQMVCTFLLNGVLCSHHEKRLLHLHGLSVYSNLSFFHYFKKSSLSFCRCAVDLVDQYDITEYGSGTKLK